MRGLVEYSSSEDGEGEAAPPAGAATTATTAAQPGLPPPRVRSFPHVAGQFAIHTHVPVEVDGDTADRMRGLVAQLAASIPGLTCVDALLAPASSSTLHLSLSRVAPLPSRDVPAFTDGLEATLTEAVAVGLPTSGFPLSLASLAVFENEGATQCFLALADAAPSPASRAAFQAAIRAVDAANALVGLPPFYPNPSPHVSFAWAPGGVVGRLRAAVADLAWPGPPCPLPVRRIACRVGKRVVVVWRASG